MRRFHFLIGAKYTTARATFRIQLISLCANSNGDVFVTGWTRGASTAEDIVTIKYNPATGDTLWVKKLVGPSSDRPLAITCDNNSVYVTGWTFNPTRDIITIKYNGSTGDTSWVRRYNGSNNGGDYGIVITVDTAMFTCCRSDVSGQERKFTILKYDASGNTPSGWPYVYIGGISTTFDEAHAVKVDASGNVYVTGEGGAVPTSDYLTIKIEQRRRTPVGKKI